MLAMVIWQFNLLLITRLEFTLAQDMLSYQRLPVYGILLLVRKTKQKVRLPYEKEKESY
jgi:hypothetical protein